MNYQLELNESWKEVAGPWNLSNQIGRTNLNNIHNFYYINRPSNGFTPNCLCHSMIFDYDVLEPSCLSSKNNQSIY